MLTAEVIEALLTKLAALTEPEYEQLRREIARLLEWRVSQLDRFVKRIRDRLEKMEKLGPAPSNGSFHGDTDTPTSEERR